MDQEYEKRYHVEEVTNWWFVARRDIIVQITSELDGVQHILDIGCSSGELVLLLNKMGYTSVTGIDISETAIQRASEKGLENVLVMDATHTSFENDQFDLIIASDVLEHIEEDKKALLEWNRILKPGGKLIIFVPAKEELWSYHDVLNHHKRRYEMDPFLKLLQDNKFTVRTHSFWNFLLYLPVATQRKLLKNVEGTMERQPELSDDLGSLPSLVNRFLLVLLQIENRLLKWIKFPTGISLFAVCEAC